MSKSINIVPIKMNKINRVKATVKPQNVRKEKIEEKEIDYSKGLDSKQTLAKYQNIMENAKSKVSKKVETKTSKVEGIRNLFGGIKEKAHDMYKSTGAKVTGLAKEVTKNKAVDLEIQALKKGIDSWKKVGASFVNFESSLGKGVLKLGEGLVDGVQIIGGVVVSPLFAAYDGLSYVGCKVTNEKYESVLTKSWEGTRKRVAYKAVDTLYDKIYDTKIGKAIDEASYLKREGTACKIVEGVSTTLGIIAASIFTGGVAAGATAGGAAAGAAGTGVVSAAASSAGIAAGIAGVKGVGEGSEEAFQNKEVSTARGVLYGVANGAYEGLQYYLGAKIGNSMPIKEGTKISAGLAKGLNSLYHIGFDAVDGGTEGGIRPLLKKIYEDKSYDELFQENGGWSAVLTGAAIGGTVSSLIEGIDAVGIGKKIFSNLEQSDVDTNLSSPQVKMTSENLINEYNKLIDSDTRLSGIMDRYEKGLTLVLPADLEDKFQRLVKLNVQIKNGVSSSHIKVQSVLPDQIHANSDVSTTKASLVERFISKFHVKKKIFKGNQETIDFLESIINKRKSTITDPNVKSIFEQLDQMHVVKVVKNESGECYYNPNTREIWLSSAILSSQNESVSIHELAHALHFLEDGGRVPIEFEKVMDSAQKRISSVTSSSVDNFIQTENVRIRNIIRNYNNGFGSLDSAGSLKNEMYLDNLKSLQSMNNQTLTRFLKELGIDYDPNSKSFFEDVALFKTNQQVYLISDYLTRNDCPGVSGTMDILDSVFASWDNPEVIVKNRPHYGHNADYYSVSESRYNEQVANYLALKAGNQTQYIDFLHYALGDEWYQMMEAQMKRIADKLRRVN